MLPKLVTKSITNDRGGRLFLRIEMVCKIMIQERCFLDLEGDRGIESDSGNHLQREEVTLILARDR